MQLRFLADTADFNYFWASILQIGIVGALILLGNIIRRKTPFLRNYLVPTGLIAGFLGLAFKYVFFGLGWDIGGTPIINEEYMHYLTYHSLALGFIALGITSAAKKTVKDGRALKSGILIVGGYLIQGIVGVLLSLGVGLVFVNYAIGKAPYAGILLPLGFGQGPGQAGNIGGVYETITGANALVGGRDFGLSVAAVGFIVATVIGTIILNIVARKKLVVRYGSDTSETFGNLEKSTYQIDEVGEIPVVESVDKFTIQAAFVLTTYLITFGVISLLSYLIVDLAGIVAVRGILWGFNFLFAILVTMIIKAVLNKLRKTGVMKRQYINNYMQNRIAGFMFDLMITAGIMSINFGKLNDPSFWVLLGLMAIVGTAVTLFYANYMSKKYFAKTRWYTFFAFFGMLTGTASEGVTLLREIDPNLKTGVAEDIVNGSGMAAIFGAPMLIITTFIYQGTMWFWISFGLLIVLFIAMVLFIHFYSKRIDRINAK
ncbi:MAG: hypothetical protein WC968_03225 [Bacilli bacterium]